jgi:hypothetical protein
VCVCVCACDEKNETIPLNVILAFFII